MNDDTTTRDRTMWTQMAFDMLYEALRTNQSDARVRAALRELKGKGLKAGYVIRKVRTHIGVQAAGRLEGILRPRASAPVSGPAGWSEKLKRVLRL